jgi:glycerophosphoryl diester phosphodiesterase
VAAMQRAPLGAARFAFLDHDGPLAFAHRGGAAEAAENTWAAFSRAYALGFRYFETDVQISADGVAVLIHDPDLTRVAGRPAMVGELRWSELRHVTIGGEQTIPRLDEALSAWPDARWNLDAKQDSSVEALIESVGRTGALERVCVTCFSDRRLARVKQALGPRLCTGMGPKAIAELRLASLAPSSVALRARFCAYGAAQVPLRWGVIPVIDARFLAFAHRAGVAVHAWTIDTEPDMNRLLDLGVDGIMTDRPTVLRRVLRRRQQWPEAR